MAVALGFAMGVGFVTASFNMSVTQAITESLNGNLKGVAGVEHRPEQLRDTETRLTPGACSGARAGSPGVARSSGRAFVVIGNEARSSIGVQAFTDAWLDDGVGASVPMSTSRAGRGPGVDRACARPAAEGLRPGDELDLSTPTGTVHLPVMAVVYNGNFGGRNVQM